MHSSFWRNKPGEIYRTTQRLWGKKKKNSAKDTTSLNQRGQRAPPVEGGCQGPPCLLAEADWRLHSAASMLCSSWTRTVTPWTETSVQRGAPQLRDSLPNRGFPDVRPAGFRNCYGPVTHLYLHGVPVLNGVSLAVALCLSHRCASGAYVGQTDNFSL